MTEAVDKLKSSPASGFVVDEVRLCIVVKGFGVVSECIPKEDILVCMLKPSVLVS